MSKRTSRHIPQNSINIIIKFKTLENRDNFSELEIFQKIYGELSVIAKKNEGDVRMYWHP